MSCKVVRLSNGQSAIVNMKRGAKLSARDVQALEEYAQYCRQCAAEAQRKRNAEAR